MRGGGGGLSGSGKSSLAIGTLYAEGMQRFIEGLSTYSRRRLSQSQRPDADRIDHLPAALALRQRPPVPGLRSTVGTMSEVLNVLRLIMSRLGTHICPNGHPVTPSVATQGMEITCPVCGAHFSHPGAESFAFNSYGACPACNGTGQRFEVDLGTLVPDEDKSIDDGAVLPWNSGGRRLYRYAAGQLGVRLDVPFRELTKKERDIVFRGPTAEREVILREGTTRQVTSERALPQRGSRGRRRCQQRQRGQQKPGGEVPHGADLLGLSRHPAQPSGAEQHPRRPQPGPDQRADPRRAARLRRAGARAEPPRTSPG